MRRLILGTLVCLVSVPAVAAAQWYGGVSAGLNHTLPADISVSVPSAGLAAVYHDVTFTARPFDSPQYYVWRVGRLLGAARHVGVELEFTHLKVIGDTSSIYGVSGTIDGVPVPAGARLPMNAVVQEYQMTHGLNFVLAMIVGRWPLGRHGRVSVVGRAGAGPTLPHAESSVLGQFQQQYQYAGVGIEASTGLVVRLTRRVSLDADYKLSRATPTISIAGGSGQTTAVSHQLAMGFVIGFAR